MVATLGLRLLPPVVFTLPSELCVVDEPRGYDPYQQHVIDSAVVRFYRALMRSAIVEALNCAKGRTPDTPRMKRERMGVYDWIKTKRFRQMCDGLGYDYWNVERTIREIVSGDGAERAQALLKEYDQEAVFYARRSTGRPPRAKETQGQRQEEGRGS